MEWPAEGVCSNHKGVTVLSLPGKVYSREKAPTAAEPGFRRSRVVYSGADLYPHRVTEGLMGLMDLEKACDYVGGARRKRTDTDTPPTWSPGPEHLQLHLQPFPSSTSSITLFAHKHNEPRSVWCSLNTVKFPHSRPLLALDEIRIN